MAREMKDREMKENDMSQTNAASQEAMNALYTILNVEGAAYLGAEAPVMEGLDVPYHFKVVRDAIKTLTALGFQPD